MHLNRGRPFPTLVWACVLLFGAAGCKTKADNPQAAPANPPFMTAAAAASPQIADDAPPPDKTGGFDGKRAFAHVVKQVAFGPGRQAPPPSRKLRTTLRRNSRAMAARWRLMRSAPIRRPGAFR